MRDQAEGLRSLRVRPQRLGIIGLANPERHALVAEAAARQLGRQGMSVMLLDAGAKVTGSGSFQVDGVRVQPMGEILDGWLRGREPWPRALERPDAVIVYATGELPADLLKVVLGVPRSVVLCPAAPYAVTQAYALFKMLSRGRRPREQRILLDESLNAGLASRLLQNLDDAVQRFLPLRLVRLGVLGNVPPGEAAAALVGYWQGLPAELPDSVRDPGEVPHDRY